jgi:hypothetical protein
LLVAKFRLSGAFEVGFRIGPSDVRRARSRIASILAAGRDASDFSRACRSSSPRRVIACEAFGSYSSTLRYSSSAFSTSPLRSNSRAAAMWTCAAFSIARSSEIL